MLNLYIKVCVKCWLGACQDMRKDYVHTLEAEGFVVFISETEQKVYKLQRWDRSQFREV